MGRAVSETVRRIAMFLSGLAGVIAFNLIIGVFGLIPAEIGGESGGRVLSERHPLQGQLVAGGVQHGEPRLPPDRSRRRDTGRSRLQRIRLLGLSRQDASGRLGVVSG